MREAGALGLLRPPGKRSRIHPAIAESSPARTPAVRMSARKKIGGITAMLIGACVFGETLRAGDSTNTSNAAAPPNIKLTGIAVFSGKKWACLAIQAGAETPPRGLTLREGERDESVEVIRILEEQGGVKIRRHGVETMLSLSN